jgi:hypothetical protein
MGIILTHGFAAHVSLISSDFRSITFSISIILGLGLSFGLSLCLPLLLGFPSSPATGTCCLGWSLALSNALLRSGLGLRFWIFSFSILITRACCLNAFACIVCLELVPKLLEGGTSIFTILLAGDASDLVEVDLIQMSARDTVNAFHDHKKITRRI